MPGGNNSYTRPANKPQRAALKREKARGEAVKNINKRRAENLSDNDQMIASKLDNDYALREMIGEIHAAGSEDRATIGRGIERAKERRLDRYKYSTGGGITAGYKYGGKVKKGYNYGGCVMSGRGGSFKGSS